MQSSYGLRLNFVTHRGEVMTLNVPHADPDISGAEVSDAMLAIINSGVVYSVRGEPLTRQSAELVRTERTEYNVSGD